MSLTRNKRNRFALRYIHKDARTAIYRALYGYAGREGSKRSNDPAQDETRSFTDHWNYQDAEKVFAANINAAMFAAAQRAHLERRLDTLRHYKQSN